MTPFEFGDVVLANFPFTDRVATKKRPCVVVNSIEFCWRYRNIVVIALTSVSRADATLKLDDWREAGLVKPTWIKPVIGTLALSRVVKPLGVLGDRDRKRVLSALDILIPPRRDV